MDNLTKEVTGKVRALIISTLLAYGPSPVAYRSS